MWSTMLQAIHTRDKDAKWLQTKLHYAQIQWAGGARGMARRLPHSRQIPARNQHHNNAIHTAHARELSAKLAEEPVARINQLLETVSRRFHRELQVNLQATSIT